jgi:replicative DNA helicase
MILNNEKPNYFAAESTKKEIYDKIFSIASDVAGRPIPYQALRNPHANKTILKSLLEHTKTIMNTNGFIDVDPCLTYSAVCSKIRNQRRKGNLNIAFIDQVSNMIQDRRYEREEISTMTRGLKKLAMELEIPIVQLFQMSREVETKGIPLLSHLKGSGSIEEDSDIVFFPFRECVIDRSKPKTEAMLIPAKGRNADGCPINMKFSTETTRFTEGNSFDT